MTARDFCFWLQGYFEVAGIDPAWGIPRDKAEVIQRHLALVFAHDIDPKADKGDPATKSILDGLHHGGDKDVKMRC